MVLINLWFYGIITTIKLWRNVLELTKNILPIEYRKYEAMIYDKRKNAEYPQHISLYILPNGDFLDCKHPQDIKHFGMAEMFYGNFATLQKNPKMQSELRMGASVCSKYGVQPASLREVEALLMHNVGVNSKNPAQARAYEELKMCMSDDDLLVHDMGYVKFLYLNRTIYITIPNYAINGQYIKQAQIETIKSLAELFSVNEIDDILEQAKVLNNELLIRLNSLLPQAKR
jgi:hypothetical protein